jgi:hypothetical protein
MRLLRRLPSPDFLVDLADFLLQEGGREGGGGQRRGVFSNAPFASKELLRPTKTRP